MALQLSHLGGVLYEHGVRLTEGDRHVGNLRVQAPKNVDEVRLTVAASAMSLDLSGTLVLSLDQAEAVGDALLEAVEAKRGSDDVDTRPDPGAAA